LKLKPESFWLGQIVLQQREEEVSPGPTDNGKAAALPAPVQRSSFNSPPRPGYAAAVRKTGKAADKQRSVLACVAAKSSCQKGSSEISCQNDPVHELSIMQSALGLALKQTREAGGGRVHVIRLRIGVLSGVVPDALEFAFGALAPGTPAEGARLVIESVPARFWCEACAREFQSEDLLAECPDCHRASGELRAGREMELASLEID